MNTQIQGVMGGLRRAQLAQAAADQARENQALAEQLLSALKDGMEEAIAHNLNYPAAPFFLEAIKDWPSNDSQVNQSPG